MDKKELAIIDYQNGLPVSNIFKKRHIAKETLYKLISQQDIKKREAYFNVNEKNIVNDYLINLLTAQQIKKKYHISDIKLIRLANKYDFKLRTNRKYYFNENFFSEINTQEKAYFLGLLFSDGHNSVKKYVVEIGLQEKDKEILERFNSIINSTKPLEFISKKYLKEKDGYNNQDIIRLRLCSKKLSNDLLKLGMVHNKSDCVFIPKVIPDGLIIHFIRGYFDGDGCLCRRTKKPIFTFGIVSKSKLIIEQISAFFKKKYEIHISIYYNKSKNIYKLGVCGNQKAYKIMSLIYTNATIYLNRKYNKYLELIQIMSSHQEQKTSKYKNISHNKKENVWVVVYQNNKTIYYIARCKTEKKAIEALTQWKQNNINLLRINE